MKNNKLFLIAIALLLMFVQGHLAQKIGMLNDYFTHPEYEFFTTFSFMDLFDLFLHGGIPLIIFIFVIRDFFKKKDMENKKVS